ncbi:hypothetical protein K1W54_24990 [Micromonospora sp. CPCC 205371]|nr:hypothetical protein [Micromonospora sp. CPCC 205371]
MSQYRDLPAGLSPATWTSLHLSARQAVRHDLVVALVKQLLDTLTSTTTSDTEAYQVFVRTVKFLNLFVVEEGR